MKPGSKVTVVECISCGDNIRITRPPKVGDFVTCHGCDEQFEIVDLDPVVIDWPYYEDDYDDYSDAYDD